MGAAVSHKKLPFYGSNLALAGAYKAQKAIHNGAIGLLVARRSAGAVPGALAQPAAKRANTVLSWPSQRALSASGANAASKLLAASCQAWRAPMPVAAKTWR